MIESILTDEQRKAISESPEGCVVRDPQSGETYVLTSLKRFDTAMKALKQLEDLKSIQQGLRELESDQGMSVDEFEAMLMDELDQQ